VREMPILKKKKKKRNTSAQGTIRVRDVEMGPMTLNRRGATETKK